MEVTFTFTEHDGIHTRGKTKEYYASKFEDIDEYEVTEETLDTAYTFWVSKDGRDAIEYKFKKGSDAATINYTQSSSHGTSVNLDLSKSE